MEWGTTRNQSWVSDDGIYGPQSETKYKILFSYSDRSSIKGLHSVYKHVKLIAFEYQSWEKIDYIC
jgi:hypothetical protein